MTYAMASQPPTRRDYLRVLPVALGVALTVSVVVGVAVGDLVFFVVGGLLFGLGMWLSGIAMSRWAWRTSGTT